MENPKIQYNINLNEKELENSPLTISPTLNQIYEQLKNLENDRNKSLLYSEIPNSIIKLNQSNSRIMNSSLSMHIGIKCEHCQMMPIIGHRYKCPKCLNYNLCENCEELNSENNFHPHEDFILIRFPDNPYSDYSYNCLTKIDKIYEKAGISKIEMRLKIKNDGNLAWPANSILKCNKEISTIFCDKVILPKVEMNEETEVEMIFRSCESFGVGEYKCYVNFVINGKKVRGPILIKVFFE